MKNIQITLNWNKVSIQPKPDNGFKVEFAAVRHGDQVRVSIQPKPENGLKEMKKLSLGAEVVRFNPAEAREWFKRRVSARKSGYNFKFQFSRSQTMGLKVII